MREAQKRSPSRSATQLSSDPSGLEFTALPVSPLQTRVGLPSKARQLTVGTIPRATAKTSSADPARPTRRI